jgi:Ca2+/Na+ antiporter
MEIENTIIIEEKNNSDIKNNIQIPSQIVIDETIEISSKPIPFWSENPNILFDPNYMFEFFPVETMDYNQKLNAISRAVIVITIITFLFTRSIRLLTISAITLAAIYVLYYYQKRELKKSKKIVEEQFENQADEVYSKYNYEKNPDVFDKPTTNNPFSNVLIPDYNYNTNKKPAPPCYNDNINNEILKEAKKIVEELNPGQPDISDKLFKDLGEQYVFEQSLRSFNSNPATTIPNDQKGFAEFCYGSMVSSRDGNPFALARNLPRYNNY